MDVHGSDEEVELFFGRERDLGMGMEGIYEDFVYVGVKVGKTFVNDTFDLGRREIGGESREDTIGRSCLTRKSGMVYECLGRSP